VEQIKQNDDRDGNPEQPKQNASTHSLLPDDEKLFLAGDLANGVLRVADRTLNPALGLISLAFGFGAGIAQGFTSLFLDFAGEPSSRRLRHDPYPLPIPLYDLVALKTR